MTEKTFEEALARLEFIIDELEKGELNLDESLKLFEEGIALARHCNAKLDEAQGKVELLLGIEDGMAKTAPFQPEEESV
ncbi:MAG TPA: exodeoxyribonuclease VII small subunit [Firmicutes bacterium]|uniref:Exodeoxyribonuclease 7 small subunit n=1 Tax=Capillibacterium thermochitinicola TaxID=2699427 RepID=A0A8J6I1S4_9FIRM|nr:exodeoxyribonuclease VII small subunit [Capillibacterium thermochitinicola]HHW11651.1 exodeoxyribonuclease VII small subunit [Bacillota bacterium]